MLVISGQCTVSRQKGRDSLAGVFSLLLLADVCDFIRVYIVQHVAIPDKAEQVAVVFAAHVLLDDTGVFRHAHLCQFGHGLRGPALRHRPHSLPSHP